MIVKLWYPCKGEFLKELELPLEYEPKQTITIITYEKRFQHVQRYKAVFVRVDEQFNYEFDYMEPI